MSVAYKCTDCKLVFQNDLQDIFEDIGCPVCGGVEFIAEIVGEKE